MVNTFKALMIILIALSTLSCNKKESEIKQTTQSFLDAYLKADFDSAAIFCTPELISETIDSLKIPLQQLDSASREILDKKLDSISAEIVSVDGKHKKDSIKVTYKVIGGVEKEILNSLVVVKAGETWKIAKLAK